MFDKEYIALVLIILGMIQMVFIVIISVIFWDINWLVFRWFLVGMAMYGVGEYIAKEEEY